MTEFCVTQDIDAKTAFEKWKTANTHTPQVQKVDYSKPHSLHIPYWLLVGRESNPDTNPGRLGGHQKPGNPVGGIQTTTTAQSFARGQQ